VAVTQNGEAWGSAEAAERIWRDARRTVSGGAHALGAGARQERVPEPVGALEPRASLVLPVPILIQEIAGMRSRNRGATLPDGGAGSHAIDCSGQPWIEPQRWHA
jgi:hypothetical protein